MAYKVALNYFTGELQLVNVATTGSGVVGIAPTTVNAIATWVDTGATTIQNSLALVQPGGGIEAQGFISEREVINLVQVNPGETWIAPELELELTGCIQIELDGEIVII